MIVATLAWQRVVSSCCRRRVRPPPNYALTFARILRRPPEDEGIAVVAPTPPTDAETASLQAA